MKIRIIPTLLTDGLTVVKGEKFDNWRTVGSAEAVARLYSRRDVDEFLFLDVNARAKGRTIDLDLVQRFSSVLNVPFSVGGGIDTLEIARRCIRNGAEKVVLGSGVYTHKNLIKEVASEFGSQAVVVAVDMKSNFSGTCMSHSGTKDTGITVAEAILFATRDGAGEILLQATARDGSMKGYDLDSIARASKETSLPVIASGGCSGPEDMLAAVKAGASALGVGALFQFTQDTPASCGNYLSENGVAIRLS